MNKSTNRFKNELHEVTDKILKSSCINTIPNDLVESLINLNDLFTKLEDNNIIISKNKIKSLLHLNFKDDNPYALPKYKIELYLILEYTYTEYIAQAMHLDKDEILNLAKETFCTKLNNLDDTPLDNILYEENN